jgi:hypothetical protein
MAEQKNPVDLWLEELRSGKWRQAKYVLHNTEEDSYCCLGVLCELYVREFPDRLVERAEGIEYVAELDTRGDEERDDDENYESPPDEAYVPCEEYYVRDANGKMDYNKTMLPFPVREWAGLLDDSGRMKDNREVALALLNDQGLTFEQIAGVIENFYDKLFVVEEKAPEGWTEIEG